MSEPLEIPPSLIFLTRFALVVENAEMMEQDGQSRKDQTQAHRRAESEGGLSIPSTTRRLITR